MPVVVIASVTCSSRIKRPARVANTKFAIAPKGKDAKQSAARTRTIATTIAAALRTWTLRP